jgi:hypothetical protein
MEFFMRTDKGNLVMEGTAHQTTILSTLTLSTDMCDNTMTSLAGSPSLIPGHKEYYKLGCYRIEMHFILISVAILCELLITVTARSET